MEMTAKLSWMFEGGIRENRNRLILEVSLLAAAVIALVTGL